MKEITAPHRKFVFYYVDAVKMFIIIGCWLIAVLTIPNNLWNPAVLQATILIGTIGTFRYSWWMINLSRGIYFGKKKFPRMRKRANKIWDAGWRPNHVHLLMTTYHERPEITERVLQGLVDEMRRESLTGTLWIAPGEGEDINIIRSWVDSAHYDGMKVVLLRYVQPGKRYAIGALLRALSRHGVGHEDFVVLFDGDSIMDKGVMKKCFSLFGAYKDLDALTTDEEALVNGPKWFDMWLKLRFAQRRMWMQSHAVSNRVLTLTGRMSMFRAAPMIEKSFIETVENDFLNHWLWGKFRFLSGDDKSTWYSLLRRGSLMTYVPDALVYTIEHIEGNGYKRMSANLMRWSGNMLRNGTRAIALGPRRMPIFIWLALLDQRISMWTIVISLSTAVCISLFVQHDFIVSYILWIILTRIMLSTALFFYSRRIYACFPFLLYLNQVIASFIKIYILFRLPRQKWSNRKNQQAGGDAMASPWRRVFAVYLTIFYVTLAITFVMFASGILEWPGMYRIPLIFS